MKKDVHPNYDEATITCACGNIMPIRSTVKQMHINACSKCHPFYTGTATFVDTEGRIEQFKKRYATKESE